ncbi:uncharacterized protein VTP21DRAFT_11641 [Calcarisporiella thermophila]|uniref:uncharacterized protein n=1 Tax=Calcarisporiella thermophila TaxID=911321 RepID=UPI0037429CF9
MLDNPVRILFQSTLSAMSSFMSWIPVSSFAQSTDSPATADAPLSPPQRPQAPPTDSHSSPAATTSGMGSSPESTSYTTFVSLPPVPPDLFSEDPCVACPAAQSDSCSLHPHYPAFLKLDRDSPLQGTVRPYSSHVMICTGKADWPDRIEEASGTVASALWEVLHAEGRVHGSAEKPRVLVSNISRSSVYSKSGFLYCGVDVVLFPDNIVVANVTPSNTRLFYDTFLSDDPSKGDRSKFEVRELDLDGVIVICSHRRRDKRCGVTAPILRRELEKVLASHGMFRVGFDGVAGKQRWEEEPKGGVAVYMISHVSGHKFAANTILYTQHGRRGIWYGRVTPCHAEAVVEQTLLNGKVIRELYRGHMHQSEWDEGVQAAGAEDEGSSCFQSRRSLLW